MLQNGVGLIQERGSESLTGPGKRRGPFPSGTQGGWSTGVGARVHIPALPLSSCVFVGMSAHFSASVSTLQNGDDNAFCHRVVVKMSSIVLSTLVGSQVRMNFMAEGI